MVQNITTNTTWIKQEIQTINNQFASFYEQFLVVEQKLIQWPLDMSIEERIQLYFFLKKMQKSYDDSYEDMIDLEELYMKDFDGMEDEEVDEMIDLSFEFLEKGAAKVEELLVIAEEIVRENL